MGGDSGFQNLQEYLAALRGDKKLLKKAPDPCVGGYKPDIDASPELDPVVANFFKLKIGILCWCVEMGCIGIINEVQLLSN
jgi:hypothetical protein